MGALAAPGPPFDMHADTCQVLRIPMMLKLRSYYTQRIYCVVS